MLRPYSLLPAVVLTTALLSSIMLVPTPAQVLLDPKSLVGEWHGEWSAQGVSGKMYLTIKDTAANTFKGRLEVAGSRLVQDDAIEGTVDGNVVKWATPKMRAELTVHGSEMRGFVYGTMRNDVVLKRK